MLNRSVMSKSSVLPETLVMLLTGTGEMSNLHKISMNINEVCLALYIDKHTAATQIHKKCRVRNTFINTATISRRRYIGKERQYPRFSTR